MLESNAKEEATRTAKETPPDASWVGKTDQKPSGDVDHVLDGADVFFEPCVQDGPQDRPTIDLLWILVDLTTIFGFLGFNFGHIGPTVIKKRVLWGSIFQWFLEDFGVPHREKHTPTRLTFSLTGRSLT